MKCDLLEGVLFSDSLIAHNKIAKKKPQKVDREDIFSEMTHEIILFTDSWKEKYS